MTEERKTQDRCRCAACGGFMACEDEQCDKCKSFSKIPCDDCFEGHRVDQADTTKERRF